MSLETYQLYDAARTQIGVKLLADALNVGVQHAHKLATDPSALDVPVRDDVARITSLLTALAARPHAKPALILFRMYFEDVFSRLLDKEHVSPLTCEGVADHVGRLCTEFAGLVVECKPGFASDRIATEASELIAAITTLVRCAEVADAARSYPRIDSRSA